MSRKRKKKTRQIRKLLVDRTVTNVFCLETVHWNVGFMYSVCIEVEKCAVVALPYLFREHADAIRVAESVQAYYVGGKSENVLGGDSAADPEITVTVGGREEPFPIYLVLLPDGDAIRCTFKPTDDRATWPIVIERGEIESEQEPSATPDGPPFWSWN